MTQLPQDYHSRWEALAQYGLEHQHGQLCRLALMYALTLRRGAAAEESQVRFIRPRVWEAEGSRKHRSERVALFDDDLVRALLRMVEQTKDLSNPNFPKVACGSSYVEVWCHSLAARKLYRGKTNFEAVSDHFDLSVGFKLVPNEIHLVAAGVFKAHFAYDASDAACVLSTQLGLKTYKMAFFVSQHYSIDAKEVARVRCQDGGLVCVFSSDEPTSACTEPSKACGKHLANAPK